MSAAFQANAFQNNAFQTSGTAPPVKKVVGWRHTADDLERRLKEQRDNTFSRRRFDELIAEAREKAAELQSKPAKAALKRAIEAVKEAAPDGDLENALEAAVLASNASRTIAAAEIAYRMAGARMTALKRQADDEEDIEFLLLH